jgi:hypothetical protein
MARRKKNDEEPIENQDNLNNDSDDTFGLPEVDYEPLKRDETTPPAEVPAEPVQEEPVAGITEEQVYEKPYESTTDSFETKDTFEEEPVSNETHHEYQTTYQNTYHYVDQERSSPWPKILLIGLLVIAALGALYYFGIYKPGEDEKRERDIAERAAAAEANKKRKLEEAENLRRQQAEQRRLDSLAAIPKEGTLEILSERTGQYYVVVASAIDDDLLTDFGNKLVKQGKSVKIIPPYGKNKTFYRLAVDAKDTYADAQAAADGMKGGDFGDQLWVVRY